MAIKTWDSLCREPLLHFAIPGVAIFLLYSWWAPPDPRAIVVTPETIEILVDERARLLERPLSGDERAAVVESFIDEEILLREARRLGLDQRDGKIRHRLVDKMRFLLDETPEDPSREELESFYRANAERYRETESVSFDHVFLSQESETTGLLADLRGGVDFTRLGEPFWLGATLEHFSEKDLAQIMGESFARALFEVEPGEWGGPLPSARGQHFVRVQAFHPAHMPSLEAVVYTVREDWERNHRMGVQSRKLAELRRRYAIERTGGGPENGTDSIAMMQASLAP